MIYHDQLQTHSAKWEKKIKDAFESVASDKPCHSYERIYQHYLPQDTNAKLNILEIGLSNYEGEVANGCGSIFAWNKLYPNAMVYGGDWNEDRMITTDKIKTKIVDQFSTSSLDAFAEWLGSEEMDIIIDDASHKFWNSQRTYQAIIHKLRSGGVYLIEDIVKPRAENGWQQRISDWEVYLGKGLNYSIVDARPENPNDNDSVMVCITKK